jgi:hypothetical protein
MPGERMGTGVGAGTVERTGAGGTEAGAVDRRKRGAGGGYVVEAGTTAGSGLICKRDNDSPDSFTMTGVPSGAFSKKISAAPAGRRMQPWEAA